MADKLIPTPSQTVGPFFHLGMDHPEWADLTADNPAGDRIAIEGRVIDGDGTPVPDAVIELWQANAAGRYNHPDDRQSDKPLDPKFRGFGRVATDAEGRFRVTTIKPGPVPGRRPAAVVDRRRGGAPNPAGPRRHGQPRPLPLRHRPAGRKRNRLSRYLRA
jgi:protocatechuate 3,4-dioxygenase beta subunit